MSDIRSFKNWITGQSPQKSTEDSTVKNLGEEFEQFFTYLFNSSRDGISILNRDFTIIGVNSTMERWYSHHPDLVGRRCYEVYHNRNAPCDVCPSIEVLETRHYATRFVPYEDRDGPRGTQELSAFPMFDDHNRVYGIIEYIRDVTEAEKEERVIGNLKKRLRFQDRTLQEQEIALKVLIKSREKEEERLLGKIYTQVNQLISPLISTLKVRLEGREEQLFVESLENYMEEIFSPAGEDLSEQMGALSFREREVAGFIRQGRSSKEIAAMLGISIKAVDYHRMNIRRKLGLTSRSVNLQSYLQELS